MPSSRQVGQSLFVFPITRYIHRYELTRRSSAAAPAASTTAGGGGGDSETDEGDDAYGNGRGCGGGGGGGGMSFWQLARRVAVHGELLIGYQLRADGELCHVLLFFMPAQRVAACCYTWQPVDQKCAISLHQAGCASTHRARARRARGAHATRSS